MIWQAWSYESGGEISNCTLIVFTNYILLVKVRAAKKETRNSRDVGAQLSNQETPRHISQTRLKDPNSKPETLSDYPIL